MRGIGSGVFSFPTILPTGPYTLVVRSDDRAFPPEETLFFVATRDAL